MIHNDCKKRLYPHGVEIARQKQNMTCPFWLQTDVAVNFADGAVGDTDDWDDPLGFAVQSGWHREGALSTERDVLVLVLFDCDWL